jgi:hypothetical protein
MTEAEFRNLSIWSDWKAAIEHVFTDYTRACRELVPDVNCFACFDSIGNSCRPFFASCELASPILGDIEAMDGRDVLRLIVTVSMLDAETALIESGIAKRPKSWDMQPVPIELNQPPDEIESRLTCTLHGIVAFLAMRRQTAIKLLR